MDVVSYHRGGIKCFSGTASSLCVLRGSRGQRVLATLVGKPYEAGFCHPLAMDGIGKPMHHFLFAQRGAPFTDSNETSLEDPSKPPHSLRESPLIVIRTATLHERSFQMPPETKRIPPPSRYFILAQQLCPSYAMTQSKNPRFPINVDGSPNQGEILLSHGFMTDPFT